MTAAPFREAFPAGQDEGYQGPMRNPAPLPEPVTAEAARWAARLTDAARPLDEAERRRLDDWCRADAAHGAALERLNRLWDDPAFLEALTDAPPARGRRALLATGAGSAAALGLAGWLGSAPLGRALADAASAPGEILAMPLPDGGGTLLLDTASAVDLPANGVHLRSGAMRLELPASAPPRRLSGGWLIGEAMPGSLFALRRHAREDRLSVLRGQVVMQGGQVVGPGRGLAFGNLARPAPHTLSAAERDAAEGFAEAWRLYENAPLSDVATELARYLRGSLMVESSIAGLRVSGRFRFAQPQGVLDILAATLPLRVQSLGGVVIRLREKI